MKNTNWIGLSAVTFILLGTIFVGLYFNPGLAGVMAAILFGLAALITAINGRTQKHVASKCESTNVDDNPKTSDPDTGTSDTEDPVPDP